MRMHDRVARALSDARHRIDPAVFEECAVALLTNAHEGVSPVPGGTDHGRDADIIRPGATAIRVVVTSSRSVEGARANLVRSLKSMRSHNLDVREVIAMSLAELNQTRRRSFELLVREYGAELVAIYDRSYFTPALAANGEWRHRVLGLPGGPYSLSPVSDPARPPSEHFNLVGRTEILAKIAASPSDMTIWGVAGAGKTSVLEGVDDVAFVQGVPTDERLLDDLIDANPSIVVVDDAGLRLDLVHRLRQLRASEGVSFRIAAVCWPHERLKLGVLAPGAEEIEMPLLPRADVAQIIMERGIRNRALIARILAQASGRAGWAALLSELMKEETTRHSVFDGVALQREVERFVFRAALPSTATPLLAMIGLLGRITTIGLNDLARHLGMQRLDLSAQLESLATGGLIEVAEWCGHTGELEKAYEVKPELLALSLAGTLFVAAAPAATAAELREWIPDAKREVLGRTIKCGLMGVEPAKGVARSLMRPVLAGAEPAPVEALKHYALLGSRESQDVFNLLRPQAYAVLQGTREPGILSSPVTDLFDVIDQIVDYRHDASTSREFLDLSVACAQSGFDYRKSVKSVVGSARGFDRNDYVDVRSLGALAKDALDWFAGDRSPTAQEVVVAVIAEIMRASFDSTRTSLTSNRSIEMRTGWYGAVEAQSLLDEAWSPLFALIPTISHSELVDLVDAVDGWAQLALGFSRNQGTSPSKETCEQATRLVQIMVGDLRPHLSDSPGLRARLRASIRHLDTVEEDDPFLRAVFDIREPSTNWRRWIERRERQILVAAQELPHEPELLCSTLVALRDEMHASKQLRWVDAIALVLNDRIDLLTDAKAWVNAIIEHRLVREAGRVLERGLATGDLGLDLVETLLVEDDFRRLLIGHCLSTGNDSIYVPAAIGAFRPEDASIVEIEYFRGNTSEDFLLALLSHDDPDARVAVAIGIIAGSKDRAPTGNLMGRLHEVLHDLRVPPSFKLNFDHEFASNLRVLAPEVFAAHFVQAAVAYRRDHDWRALDFFNGAAAALPEGARAEAWRSIPLEYRSSRAFRALAGTDATWISKRMDAGDVEPAMVVSAMSERDGGLTVADLATLVLPYGVDALEIACVIQFGTSWGEDHERLSAHIDYFEQLSASERPEHRAVAAAGLRYFRPQLEQALVKARRAEVTGEYF